MNTAFEFLERERHLLRMADEGAANAEFLWIWETRPLAVVAGRGGSLDQQVRLRVCEQQGVPVLRRESGGGAVLLGRGCLNYSFILDMDRRPGLRDVAASQQLLLSAVAEASAVKGACPTGGDLAVGGRKFGGCAQRRLRHTLLHHGTILYDFPIPRIDQFLHEPVRQPAYRNHRPHADFLTNVSVEPASFASRLHALYPDTVMVPA